MPTRRTPDDPWYTALYREPHTLGWAPAALTFVLVFAIDRFGFDESIGESTAWAALVAAVHVATAHLVWRGNRQ
jgi:hypothetical protein